MRRKEALPRRRWVIAFNDGEEERRTVHPWYLHPIQLNVFRD